MEELLKQLLNEVRDLKQNAATKEDINAIQCEISQIKQEISSIKQDMGTKTQQRENTDIIKAILHNQEEFSAQMEALTLNTVSKTMMENVATKEDISKLDAKFEVLNSRLFNQETEVARLKAVK